MRKNTDSVSQFLNDFKDKANISVAELTDIIGISKSSTYEYLRNEKEPTINTILRIKNALEISCDDLLTWNTFREDEKRNVLDKVNNKLAQLRFKHLIKTNATDFFTNKHVTMYAKEDIYNYIKDLYYEEKRKVD